MLVTGVLVLLGVLIVTKLGFLIVINSILNFLEKTWIIFLIILVYMLRKK